MQFLARLPGDSGDPGEPGANLGSLDFVRRRGANKTFARKAKPVLEDGLEGIHRCPEACQRDSSGPTKNPKGHPQGAWPPARADLDLVVQFLTPFPEDLGDAGHPRVECWGWAGGLGTRQHSRSTRKRGGMAGRTEGGKGGRKSGEGELYQQTPDQPQSGNFLISKNPSGNPAWANTIQMSKL